jgi:leader peptidase (prepilin peptidase)/N-methyltransferase
MITLTGTAGLSALSDAGPVLVVAVGVLGLVVGSFLNVVVWRVPIKQSVVSPPSACPRCEHRIRWWDNIPVVSWVVLRGRCRDCSARIAVRYPLVELGTGVLFALAAWRFGLTWPLLAYLWLVAVGIALALIDLEHKRLPDVLVFPSYPVVVGLLVLASANPGGAAHWSWLLRGAIGAAALAAFYFVMWWFGGMGWGDASFMAGFGAVLGWKMTLLAFYSGIMAGGAGIAWLMLRGKVKLGRKDSVPLVPYLAAGGFFTLLCGPEVIQMIGMRFQFAFRAGWPWWEGWL